MGVEEVKSGSVDPMKLLGSTLNLVDNFFKEDDMAFRPLKEQAKTINEIAASQLNTDNHK